MITLPRNTGRGSRYAANSPDSHRFQKAKAQGGAFGRTQGGLFGWLSRKKPKN